MLILCVFANLGLELATLWAKLGTHFIDAQMN